MFRRTSSRSSHSLRTCIALVLVAAAVVLLASAASADSTPSAQDMFTAGALPDTIRVDYSDLKDLLHSLTTYWTANVVLPRTAVAAKDEFETSEEQATRLAEWDAVNLDPKIAALQRKHFIVAGIPLRRGEYDVERGSFAYIDFAALHLGLPNTASYSTETVGRFSVSYWSTLLTIETVPTEGGPGVALESPTSGRKRAVLRIEDLPVDRDRARDWARMLETSDLVGQLSFRLPTFDVLAVDGSRPTEKYIYTRIGVDVEMARLVVREPRQVILELVRGVDEPTQHVDEPTRHEEAPQVPAESPGTRREGSKPRSHAGAYTSSDLINGTVGQWLDASSSQRQRAAEVMVARLHTFSSQTEMTRAASELAACITEASDPAWSAMALADIAAACALLMGY